MKKTPVLAIIGPTAVGKTSLSLELADQLGAEVLSVDSRQVYRYMDVGTDKASPVERRRVVHHLIDLVDPDQTYTASDFVRDGADAVNRILKRGRVPLFVGGTPFYYQALFSGLVNVDVKSDAQLRAELEGLTDDQLDAQLTDIDPLSARRIPRGDRYRRVRALEICRLAGEPASQVYARAKKAESPYDVLYLGLNRDRDELRTIIARRVKEQFEGGYPEEVRWLLDRGFSPELPSMKGFGYRELVLFHQGQMTYQEALESDVTATRQFAKRQMTWFRKFEPALWFDLSVQSRDDVAAMMVQRAQAHLEGQPWA